MRRHAVLSAGFLLASLTVVYAADTYPVPPNPASGAQMCATAFDTGQPNTTGNKTAWNVSANGKYNYDNAWQFKSLEVYLKYLPTNKAGPTYTVTDESTLATKGTWTITFSNVAPPGANEKIVAIARITVKQAGQIDKTNSTTADVLGPLGGGGGSCDEENQQPE